jgi:hypothetical protein
MDSLAHLGEIVAYDPHPNKALLLQREVAEMLSADAANFAAFVRSQPLFPRSITIGRDKRGNPIKRWRKAHVLAFLELFPGDFTRGLPGATDTVSEDETEGKPQPRKGMRQGGGAGI